MNILTQPLTLEALTKALELSEKILPLTQADDQLDGDAKAAWKHEIEASDVRIREIKARFDANKEEPTTHKDRCVFMMHLSLCQRYTQIVNARKPKEEKNDGRDSDSRNAEG